MHTGNTLAVFFNWLASVGLSLCIQETQRELGISFWDERFIPVHTGNAGVLEAGKRNVSVYPCAYRERFINVSYREWPSGLSLCIQGTPHHYRLFQCRLRFIPVHTGNAIDSVLDKTYYPVYPCAYRERWSIPPARIIVNGLSLCIQGTQLPKYQI